MSKNDKAVQEILNLKRKLREKVSKIDDEATLSLLKLQGGRRAGSGRNPVEDRKVQFQISLKQSQLDAIGGRKKAQEIALEAIKKFISEKD